MFTDNRGTYVVVTVMTSRGNRNSGYQSYRNINVFVPGIVARETVSVIYLGKGKVVLVTGRGGPQGCEASRLPTLSKQSAERWR
jgi:hypothetical protein